MTDPLASSALRLIGAMRSAVIIYDTEGRYEYINRAAAELYDIDPEETLGTSVVDCHPKETHVKVLEQLEEFRSGELKVKVMDDIPVRGRRTRETMIGLWEGGTYMGLACVYEDITDLLTRSEPEDHS